VHLNCVTINRSTIFRSSEIYVLCSSSNTTMTYPNIHKWVDKLGLFVCILSHSLITWTPFFNVCFHVYCKYNSLLFHIFLLICVFVSIAVQLYGNSSIHVRSHSTYLKEEKRVPVKLGVVAPLDPARYLHSYKVQPMDISIRHPRFYATNFISSHIK